MADLLIVFPAFLQLLGKFILTLGGCCHLAGIPAVIHHILHPVDLGFVHALHLVQVVDTQVTDGIRRIAMQVNQCLEAVLLAAVKQPVDRTLAGASDRICLAMILEKVIQEVIADDFSAGAALIAKGFCDVIEVCFQRVSTVHCFQPCTQARYNIIVQIFFIGDRDNIVGIREEHFVDHNTLIAVCTFQFISRNRSGAVVHLIHKRLQGIRFSRKKQAILVNRVPPKHTAHGIGQQRHNFITVSACIVAVFHTIRHFIAIFKYTVYRYVFIFYFRRQFILQPVNINKNTVQLFFVFFQLLEPQIALIAPSCNCFFDIIHVHNIVLCIFCHFFRRKRFAAHKRMYHKVPACFKRVPILFCPMNTLINNRSNLLLGFFCANIW